MVLPNFKYFYFVFFVFLKEMNFKLLPIEASNSMVRMVGWM